MRAGWLATWLILQASIEGPEGRKLSLEGQRCLAWVKAKLEQELLALNEGTPERVACLDAQSLSDLVAGYAEHIGDMAQTLPPMDFTADPLLLPGPHPPVN